MGCRPAGAWLLRTRWGVRAPVPPLNVERQVQVVGSEQSALDRTFDLPRTQTRIRLVEYAAPAAKEIVEANPETLAVRSGIDLEHLGRWPNVSNVIAFRRPRRTRARWFAAIRHTHVLNALSPRNDPRCVRTMTRISCAASSASAG